MLAHEPPLADPDDLAIPQVVATITEAVDLLTPHMAAFAKRKGGER
jgi:hypothetical protein